MSETPLPQHDADRTTGPGTTGEPGVDRVHRARPEDRGAVAEPPRKQEGDALLDGSGSRQGRDTDPVRDAAPHE